MASVRSAAENLKAAFSQPLTESTARSGMKSLLRHTLEAETVLGKVGGVVVDALKFIPRVGIGATKVVGKVAFGASAVTAVAVGAGTVYVAKQPIAGALNLAAGAVRGVRRHPMISGAVALGGALYALSGWLSGRAAQATEQDLMAQAMAAQQQAAMVPPSPAYGLQPGEFEAQVAPRLRGGAEAASTGHAAAVTAARAQAPTPETAAAL